MNEKESSYCCIIYGLTLDKVINKFNELKTVSEFLILVIEVDII